MLKIIKRYYAWIILIIAVFAQFYFPVSSIIEKNDILKTGMEFKIKTRPIDPADPFRGRYVAIYVAANVAEELREPAYTQDKPFYIRLITDEEGFARVAEMSREPLEGDGVLKIQDTYYGGGALLRLPFDRYYMQEEAAPKAEKLYNEQRNDAYVTIKVKKNKGVVSGLFIDDIRIEDYVKQQ